MISVRACEYSGRHLYHHAVNALQERVRSLVTLLRSCGQLERRLLAVHANEALLGVRLSIFSASFRHLSARLCFLYLSDVWISERLCLC